jgi:hypothetical protein
MILFRVISTILLVAVSALIVTDGVKRFGSLALLYRAFRSGLPRGWMPAPAGDGSGMTAFRRLISVAVVLLLGLLGFTGFLPVILLGKHMSGTMLLIHVTAAPLFALALAAASLVWSHRLRFVEQDAGSLKALASRPGTFGVSAAPALSKACFWATLALALPLMLSIILTMFPWFGTDASRALLGLHGYSAVALVVIAKCNAYLSILQSPNTQPRV